MQTKYFFEALSVRLKNENDLSDITLAMCLSCESFRNDFLHFFFPEMIIDENISIDREVSEEDSRPDFLIENKGIIYLIENKINDKNQHFGQYDKTFNVTPERFGYITNYVINDENIIKKGYKLHTWEELYDCLSKKTFPNDGENTLLKGYLEYVKNVCSIIKITKAMKLDGIYSLFSLIEILKKEIVNRETELFTLGIYSTNSAIQNSNPKNGITGVNFQLTYKKNITTDIWGWIGIYYNREKPLICMGFPDKTGWGKPFIDLFRDSINQLSNKKSFKKPYYEEGSWWFEMTDDLLDKFNESNDLNEQKNILKEYMDEVLLCPFQTNKTA